ncbi:MAG TPA: hypothetical protein VF484_07290 [Candidatus Limnocylindrales bacterium]
MRTTTALRLALAHEHIARAHRQAEAARLAEEARHVSRLTLRQRAGRLLIAAGHRLAAEPTPRLARSA